MNTSTPLLRTRLSTHTCWGRGKRSVSTETSTHTSPSQGAWTHKDPWSLKTPSLTTGKLANSRFRSHLNRLLHFPSGLWATTSAWWTMWFTRARARVTRSALRAWGRGWSRREGTEEKIGFGFFSFSLDLLELWDIHSLASVWLPDVQPFQEPFFFFSFFSRAWFCTKARDRKTLCSNLPAAVTVFSLRWRMHLVFKAEHNHPLNNSLCHCKDMLLSGKDFLNLRYFVHISEQKCAVYMLSFFLLFYY